ncbi:hypothetical protein EDB19DRAFT_1904767 [Suillus lakei]|nr:hypothetical protein EDB19DRAFT_1904767 [Suillus lakei]
MPMITHRDHSALQIPCGYLHCEHHFKTQAGRKKHWNTSHPILKPASPTHLHAPTVKDEPEEQHNDLLTGHDDFPAGHDDFPAGHDNLPADLFDASQALDDPDNLDTEFWEAGDRLYRNHHPKLNARPCDATGQFLEDGALPTPPPSKSPDDWTPYRNHVEFETAEFLYTRNQMSIGDINILLDLWAATLLKHNDKPLFVDCHDLHKTIDSTPVGDVKWQSFKVQYSGEKPAHNIPPWMDQSHDVWYRDPHEVIQNMLANPDYATEMDYRPYCEFSTDGNACQWQDFMSGDWAWNQTDIISKDPDTTGSTFVPVILGSDKTTVSVATGANNYYLLFLAMPKTTKEHASCPKYRKYRHQWPGMTKPKVVRFGDDTIGVLFMGLDHTLQIMKSRFY